MADYNLTEREKELLRWLVENVRAHDYEDEFIFMGTLGQRPAVELSGIEGRFETTESILRALQDDGFVTLRPDPSGFALHGTLRQKAFDAVDDNFEIQPIIASLISEEEFELLRQQLKVRRENLAKLELQAARYGMTPPLEILNAIEQEQSAIAELEARLQTIEFQLRQQQGIAVSREQIQSLVIGEGSTVQIFDRASPVKQEFDQLISMMQELLGRTTKLAEDGTASEFRPIFRGRGFRVEEDLCFVLMPFGPEDLQIVYRDHLKPTVERCGLRCERSDDIYGPNVVIEDIWAGINRARFIIAELSGRNPNVFYEVGLCHVVGRDAIFLAQDINDVPFDLRHFRVIVYDYTPRGVKQLEETLDRTIKALLQQSE
jgi:hypothetical protein